MPAWRGHLESDSSARRDDGRPRTPAQAPAVLTSLPSISVSMSERRSSARTPAKTKATDVEDDRQMTSPARATRRATAKTPAKTTAKTPARSTRASAKKDKPHKPKTAVGFLLKYLLVVFLFIGVARVFNGPFPMELRLKENIAAKRAELFERAEHARATKEKIQAATPLVFAAGEGDIDEVRRLLDAGHARHGAHTPRRRDSPPRLRHPRRPRGCRGAPPRRRRPRRANERWPLPQDDPLHWMTHGGHVDGMRLLRARREPQPPERARGDLGRRRRTHGAARRARGTHPTHRTRWQIRARVGRGAPPPTIPRPSPNRRRPGPAGGSPEDAIDRARADVTLEGEEDVSEAQKAKREKAQRLMRQFQEQAEELKRLHAQAMASKPDEL